MKSDERHRRERELHQRAARHYERRYGPAFAREYQRYWNRLLLELVPPGTRAVLDVGCGSGVLLAELVERFPEVVGLDLSPEMLANVPPHVAERCTLLTGAVEDAPLPRHHFDAVICRGALHHVGDLPAALTRLAESLRPGGVLILSEPCADSLFLRLPRWLWRTFSARFDEDHRALGSRDLCRTLAAAGLAAETQRKLGFLAFPLCSMSDILPLLTYVPGSVHVTRFLIRVDQVLERLPLVRRESWHIVLRARRESLRDGDGDHG